MLTLPNVQAAHAGTYTVLVANPFSLITSDGADLALVGAVPTTLSFGETSVEDGFLIRLTASVGETIELQTSSDLVTWQTLADLTLTSQSIEYFDADAANFPNRFYRAVARP